VAYYSFDQCTGFDDSGNNSNGLLFGSPVCECGVDGLALRFDGVDDYVLIGGPVNAFLENTQFTIAFFVKPLGSAGTGNLLSKSDTCTFDRSMVIKTDGPAQSFDLAFTETAQLGHRFSQPYDTAACWQHVAITMKNNQLGFYLNGVAVSTSIAAGTPDLDNSGALMLGTGECTGVDGSGFFDGLLDELYVYSRALDPEEILEMYEALAPDRIVTLDAIIFQGQSINTLATNTCATDIAWVPGAGTSDSTILEPELSPFQSTRYRAYFTDAYGCTTFDSLYIQVLDPDSFPCNRLLVPTAFTPNADGLNDALRISNAPVIDELLAFEVYDRWGNRVFVTEDLNGSWDGNYGGSPINPGTYLWRVNYRCNGRENVSMGEVTLIR
jgi:gliding motility-associated-like protein